jgi:hypothetical protein
VPEHEAVVPRRRLAVLATDDLRIGAADADGHDVDEDVALVRGRLGDVGQLEAVRLLGDHRERSHVHALPITTALMLAPMHALARGG